MDVYHEGGGPRKGLRANPAPSSVKLWRAAVPLEAARPARPWRLIQRAKMQRAAGLDYGIGARSRRGVPV